MSSEEDDAQRKDEDDEYDEDDECPPRLEDEKEMLFLIEFLVDTMLLKPENMDIHDMDPCLLQGQTCVCLTFLHFPPMCICEKDVDPCRQTGHNYIKYNSGKSLMFALSESQFENPPPIYLDVSAHKMLPHGSVPNKLHIGVTKICLSELFKQVFEKVEEKPDRLPLSKSIKDKYQLVGKRKKCPTAEVTIYIRLSCLGQNIVTEFQRGMNECEPFLFKNKESTKVYQCLAKDAPDDDAEDLCPAVPGWGMTTGRNCGNGDGKMATGSTCGTSARASNYPGNMDQCSNNFRMGPSIEEGEEFDEFGTEVHGHALTIKVQRCQKKQTGGADSDVQETNDVSFQMPQNLEHCNKGKSGNRAQVYAVNSAMNGSKCGDNSTQIIQGVDSPDKDIFVVRIGKKGESGKGKLELELRTPKQKIERPVNEPKKWDKVVQTDKDESEGKGKKKKKK